MQRVALPQAPTSDPSALKMRMKTSAFCDGSMTITWSQPTPVERSPMRCASSAPSLIGRAARVEHDEIVAEAVHFAEGDAGGVDHQPIYGPTEPKKTIKWGRAG